MTHAWPKRRRHSVSRWWHRGKAELACRQSGVQGESRSRAPAAGDDLDAIAESAQRCGETNRFFTFFCKLVEADCLDLTRSVYYGELRGLEPGEVARLQPAPSV